MGPVEEFRTGDSGLNFAEAKPGETFVKIGVGVLRKPDDKPYTFQRYYEIVNSGKWTVRKSADAIVFTQQVTDPATGYGYLYRKTVRLTPGKPQLVLEHSLKNTGKKTIDSTVYDHNFFTIDRRPIGPDISFTFPFELKAPGDIAPVAEARGKQLVYMRDLPEGKSVATEIEGFGPAASDYDIRLENAGPARAYESWATGGFAHVLLVNPRHRLRGAVYRDAYRAGARFQLADHVRPLHPAGARAAITERSAITPGWPGRRGRCAGPRCRNGRAARLLCRCGRSRARPA